MSLSARDLSSSTAKRSKHQHWCRQWYLQRKGGKDQFLPPSPLYSPSPKQLLLQCCHCTLQHKITASCFFPSEGQQKMPKEENSTLFGRRAADSLLVIWVLTIQNNQQWAQRCFAAVPWVGLPSSHPAAVLSCPARRGWAAGSLPGSSTEATQVPWPAAHSGHTSAQLKRSFSQLSIMYVTSTQKKPPSLQPSSPQTEHILNLLPSFSRCAAACLFNCQTVQHLHWKYVPYFNLQSWLHNNWFSCILCKYHNAHLQLTSIYKVITVTRTKQTSKLKGRSVYNR